ncbi:unnamed protein product [Prorocentrum cordatum]|uniref:DUF4116 domain-containing protein n=1 Tax=Prorocentrum cordatum TaxID=2364126 RepID=A0ABN9TTM0_9DINO|nr:unnamed protein product [Polarella glacialis]
MAVTLRVSTSDSRRELCALGADLWWRSKEVKEAVRSKTGISVLSQRLYAGADELPLGQSLEDIFPGLADSRTLSLRLERRSLEQGQWLERVGGDVAGTALRGAPAWVRADREVAATALRASWRAYGFLADELRADPEFARLAVKGDLRALEHVPAAIWEERDFVLDMTRLDWHRLPTAIMDGISDDRDAMLIGARSDWRILEHASPRLKADKELLLEAIRQAGWSAASWLVTDETRELLRGDKEAMLAALEADWRELEFASRELRGDRDVALAAVRQDWRALRWISEELRSDLEVMLAAVQQDWCALSTSLEEFPLHRDVLLEMVRRNWQIWAQLPARLRADEELAAMAVAQSWQALQYCLPEQLADRGLARSALAQSALAFLLLDASLGGDKELVLMAVRTHLRDPFTLTSQRRWLRWDTDDADVVSAAFASGDPEVLALASEAFRSDCAAMFVKKDSRALAHLKDSLLEKSAFVEPLVNDPEVRWKEVWTCHGANCMELPQGPGGWDELPFIQVQDIRYAALSFPWQTSMGYVRVHPRNLWFASDEGLAVSCGLEVHRGAGGPLEGPWQAVGRAEQAALFFALNLLQDVRLVVSDLPSLVKEGTSWDHALQEVTLDLLVQLVRKNWRAVRFFPQSRLEKECRETFIGDGPPKVCIVSLHCISSSKVVSASKFPMTAIEACLSVYNPAGALEPSTIPLTRDSTTPAWTNAIANLVSTMQDQQRQMITQQAEQQQQTMSLMATLAGMQQQAMMHQPPGGDQTIAIVLKQGSARREATKVLHHECNFLKMCMSEDLDEMLGDLRNVTTQQKFHEALQQTIAECTSDKASELGLDKVDFFTIDPEAIDAMCEKLWAKIVAQLQELGAIPVQAEDVDFDGSTPQPQPPRFCETGDSVAKVIRGSGMGLPRSGEVADPALLTGVERWSLTHTNVRDLSACLRFRGDITTIGRHGHSPGLFVRGLRCRYGDFVFEVGKFGRVVDAELRPSLWKDRELLTIAVRQDIQVALKMEDVMWKDNQVVLAAMSTNPQVLEHAPESVQEHVWSQPEVVRAAVEHDWRNMEKVAVELWSDFDEVKPLVLAAVRQNWLALKEVRDEKVLQLLWADHDVLLAAVRQSWRALASAPRDSWTDRQVVLEAVGQCWDVLQKCPSGSVKKKIWEDKEIVLAAVGQDWQALKDTGLRVGCAERSARSVFRARPEEASRECREDVDVVVAAARQNWRALELAPKSAHAQFWELREFVRAAVAQEAKTLFQVLGGRCYGKEFGVAPLSLIYGLKNFCARGRARAMMVADGDRAAGSKLSLALSSSSVAGARGPDAIPPFIFDEVPDGIMALGCFATSQPTDSAFAAPEPKTNAKSPAQGKSGEQMARKQARAQLGSCGRQLLSNLMVRDIECIARKRQGKQDSCKGNASPADWAGKHSVNGMELEAAKNFRSDKEIMISAVRQKPEMLRMAEGALQADKDLALAAVGADGLVLEHCAGELRADRDVVLCAITQNMKALIFASPELKEDLDLLEEACSGTRSSAARGSSVPRKS